MAIVEKSPMHIRPLEKKDAPLMLTWMHDPSSLAYLRLDGRKATLADALAFIEAAGDSTVNAHFAIADATDAYLGTVSLKGIDETAGTGELAIVLCREARGIGAGTFGICALLEYAFQKRSLGYVYLLVVEGHQAGIACYERVGFRYGSTLPEPAEVQGKSRTMLRYEFPRDRFDPNWRNRFSPPQVSLVQQLRFLERGDERGLLVIAECGREIPFLVRRVFYIYGSDRDVVRGRHANRRSEFVLINVAGSSKVRVTDGTQETVYSLTQAYEGLYLPRMVWKEMYDFSPDSVLLVLSNERYDPAEYVRDYDTYLGEVEGFGKAVDHHSGLL